jgi:hypothetical protein
MPCCNVIVTGPRETCHVQRRLAASTSRPTKRHHEHLQAVQYWTPSISTVPAASGAVVKDVGATAAKYSGKAMAKFCVTALLFHCRSVGIWLRTIPTDKQRLNHQDIAGEFHEGTPSPSTSD